MSVFELSERTQHYRAELLNFMDSHIYPAESVYDRQMCESGDPHLQPPILEELKDEARRRGLWNLFHPHPEWGPGLTNLEYAPLAEIMGRSHIASEACNCSAPDTGNMEVLTLFGTDEHKRTYLEPLLAGEIRSAFAMTEPAVASSDATNIELRMERDGDAYVTSRSSVMSTARATPRCSSTTSAYRRKTSSPGKERALRSAKRDWAPDEFTIACVQSEWPNEHWS